MMPSAISGSRHIALAVSGHCNRRHQKASNRQEMKLSSRQIKNISVVILTTTFLTWFFYYHENLPKPIRAVTAILETPVAISSGISFYCNLGIPVFETPWAVILTNLIFSFLMVYLAGKSFHRYKQSTNNK